MGKLGSQTEKYQMKALVASGPEKTIPLMQHYEGFTRYTDKLKFALQLKLDTTGNFMTASETHASACV